MAIQILMPALSPTMTEGKLAAWLKPTGAYFKPGADKGALPAFFRTGGGDGEFAFAAVTPSCL